jgi:hypothetical protein
MSDIQGKPRAYRSSPGVPERTPFASPIVVWLVPRHHRFGVRRIRDVEEGRAAIFRYGMQDLRRDPVSISQLIWTDAWTTLAAASCSPEPALIIQARAALVRAAMCAEALASPDELSELSANGWDFAP